ncbi:MAG TPA: hypothetical protein VJN64_11055 [Terriglobales bacterium]|nr:hypothetical protein [Terriglobales bacterium]
MRKFILSAFILALPGCLFSQTGVTDPVTLKICAQVKDTPVPASDRPTPNEAQQPAPCNSQELYYGFDKTPDPVAARKCAYLEMQRGDLPRAFAGPTILTMIYANGKGVTRNYDLALKFACQAPGAAGDVAGRVRQLERYKQSNWQGDGFSICEHSSGRVLYRDCAILDERFDHLDREKKLNAIAAQWKPEAKEPFQELRHAAAAFFQVEAAKGLDLSASFEIQERAFLERQFLQDLDQLVSGDLPSAKAADAAKAEKDMQAAYDAAVAHKPSQSSTVTSEGIKESQQEWLRYRQAWLKFANREYPAVALESWNAWLDGQRTEMLQRALY